MIWCMHVHVYMTLCTPQLTIKATAEIICNLFSGPTTVIKLMPTQKQEGGVDCGLFAIAMTTGVAFGVDSTALMFSQTKMRDHLVECFNNGVLSLFPNDK